MDPTAHKNSRFYSFYNLNPEKYKKFLENPSYMGVIGCISRGVYVFMVFQHVKDCILFTYRPNKSKISGFYDDEDDFIYLSTDLSLLEREITYFHESAHRKCHKLKCKCLEKAFLSEYHAYKGELQCVVALQNSALRDCYMKLIQKELMKMKANLSVWGIHLKALRKLMKTKIYRDL